MAQNTALQKPSRVEQARGRLDAAVARLESALAARPAALAAGDGDGSRHAALDTALAEAGAQVSRLQSELDKVRATNADLARVNDQVASRIDGVIANLKTSLGE